MKKKAFTLAEILITLVIIGVVAAVLAPTVNKLKPDKNKTLYLKSYDALTKAVKKVSNDSSIYAPVYEYGNSLYNVQHYPLLNISAGVDKSFDGYTGNDKLGHVLKDTLGGTGDNISDFTTSNGVQWNISASEIVPPATAADGFKFRNKVVIDVNGSAGPNSTYSANVPKPDRFVFYITADGRVIPADQCGQLYIDHRISLMRNKNEASKIANYTDLENAVLDNTPNAVIPKSEVEFNETSDIADQNVNYQTGNTNANTAGGIPTSSSTGSGGNACKSACGTHLNGTDLGIAKYKECLCLCDGGTNCSGTTDPCAGKTGVQKDSCECEKTNSNATAVKRCMCKKGYNNFCVTSSGSSNGVIPNPNPNPNPDPTPNPNPDPDPDPTPNPNPTSTSGSNGGTVNPCPEGGTAVDVTNGVYLCKLPGVVTSSGGGTTSSVTPDPSPSGSSNGVTPVTPVTPVNPVNPVTPVTPVTPDPPSSSSTSSGGTTPGRAPCFVPAGMGFSEVYLDNNCN